MGGREGGRVIDHDCWQHNFLRIEIYKRDPFFLLQDSEYRKDIIKQFYNSKIYFRNALKEEEIHIEIKKEIYCCNFQ